MLKGALSGCHRAPLGQGKGLFTPHRPVAPRAGIGLPAVAASGAITANSLASVDQHLSLLDELGV